uniref:Uncharacterized protein n=1 Tax=Anguilla anguilla TaxID=7936 RepID=A0A0E9UI88_ANGAN
MLTSGTGLGAWNLKINK